MQLCVLSSGSKANSLFLREGDTRILVDAGLGIRALIASLEEIGEHPRDLNAIFITHEHADHTRALNRLLRHAIVPVYGSAGTLGSLEDKLPARQISYAMNGELMQVGPFAVRSIPVSHDAAEPTAYHIVANGSRITVATDLGEVSKELGQAIQDSTCLVLESNHDEDLLESGPYPQLLKDRIRSSLGHLSNLQTATALAACEGTDLRHVVLAHLSEDNNDPLLARGSAESALAHCAARVHLTAQRTLGPFLTL